MKKKLLLFIGIISLSLFIACKKDNLKHKISGTWEHKITQGGLMQPNAPTQNVLLKFTEKTYEFYVDNKKTESGTYVITSEKSWDGDFRIIFDGQVNASKKYIRVSGSMLIIFDGAPISADGSEQRYIRKK